MNTSTRGRPNKASHLTVAPVTHAIRTALAVSVTLLALGGSRAAFAQSCAFTTPATETCEGAFTGTLPDPSFFTPVADLTLVLGDSANSVPTSVIPVGGLIGIDASWDGNVGVTSYADITTEGATGIFAYGSASVSVDSEGSITTDVTADGAKAMDVSAYGDISVVNNGPVDAYSAGVYDVTAVSAYSIYGKVSVDNQSAGTITATAQDGNALAVSASAFGDSVFGNEGTITAYSANGVAAGVIAYAYQGDVSATNSGSISATSGNYQAVGLTASASHGNATVDNSGSVSASGGQDQTIGIESSGYLASTVNNSGGVTASSSAGTAIGIQAQAANEYGYTTVQNSGTIQANGYGLAFGIDASGDGGSTVENSGYINASARAEESATAYGVSNLSAHLASLDNDTSGTLRATAQTLYGTALAIGAYVDGVNAITLQNDGAISASASSYYGVAQAYAAVVEGSNGTSQIINGGDINADASAGTGAYARAVGALAVGGTASIVNDANISATASASHGGTTSATGARATGTDSAIYTYGDLDATAMAVYGGATATGADVHGSATATFYNAGSLAAHAVADGAATVIGASSVGIYNAYATNEGAISATGTGAQANAVGLLGESYFAASTTNDGSISVVADGTLAPYGQYEAVATGIYTYATLNDATVRNGGSVSVSALATADIGDGSGWLVAKAIGVRAANPAGYGEALIENAGTINASAITGHGYASAWGAVAQSGSYGNGDAEIDNDGSISSSAHANDGSAMTIGAYVHSGNTATLVNHGDITATSRGEQGVPGISLPAAYATGVNVYGFAYGSGGASVSNYGSIEADASVKSGITGATALQIGGSTSSVYNAAGATILATGEDELYGSGRATAIEASGVYGIDIVNDGNITAYGHAHAYVVDGDNNYGLSSATAVYARANYRGNVSVVNHGDILAQAVSVHGISYFNAGAGTTGVSTYAKYNAVVENTGNISAISEAELGGVGAYGVMGRGKYYTHIINDAGASIVASATAGSLDTDDHGARAVAFGTHTFGSQNGVTYNAGSIVASAVVTDDVAHEYYSQAHAWGIALGAYSNDQKGEAINVGDIEATASADFGHATSFGTYVLSQYDSITSNAGTIESHATAVNGDAFAVGAYGDALHAQYIVDCSSGYCDYANATFIPDAGTATLDNSGQITATATAVGGTGHAYGATVLGAFDSEITNSGHISGSVDADDADAFGALANSTYGYSMLQNSGSISAAATGLVASATGAFVAGAYGNADNGHVAASIDNQGSISAKATGTAGATAIGLNAVGWKSDGIQIDNAGTIGAAAYGTGATATGILIDSHGSVVLNNSGTIGAYGEGTRIAVATAAGATATIVNAGTMVGAITTGDLDDSFDNAAGASWHAVGSSDFGGGDDHVANHGALFMDNAEIHLGGYVDGNTFDNFGTISVTGGGNVIDMDNPFPVSNNGVISFVDGAPDDVLTIIGDFAGEGAINVDVSGLHQSSDQLYVQGNVAGSTNQIINVNLLDMPTAPSMNVPVVTASGTLGGTFTLGQVQYPRNGFVSMDFGVKTTGSAVSLAVDVTGLTNTGSLAADLSPGVQSLVNSEVGTWRQRMGVVPEQGTHGVAPWVRMFSDSGDVDPHRSTNFGVGGNGAFHQTNQGLEFGLDMRVADHLSAGLLIGTSNSNQHLGQAGGSDHLDGRTYGLYGTWLADNSFYFDVSQRWTSVWAHFRSAAATPATAASAAALNVEAGVTAWTMAGIHVVPQVQYTHTRIDDISPLNSQGETFINQGGVSSRGRLGVAFDKTIQGTHFSWTPYGSINAVREFNGKYDYAIDGGGLLGATNTQGTSAMVELGLGARQGGFSITGGVNWTDGGALQNVVGGQVVMRYNW